MPEELNIHLRTESLAVGRKSQDEEKRKKNKLQTLLLHNLIKPPTTIHNVCRGHTTGKE